MKNFYLYIIVFFANISFSQVVINEIDTDTNSTDALEFLELKSDVPNFSLNGYCVVFFNGTTAGTGISSYYAIDLDGFSTDANGNFLMGNPFVSPTPQILIPITTIQNGPDGVGLYLANATDFPLNTPATTLNLVASLAYTNSTTLPTGLMSVFNTTVCPNENIGGTGTSKSIQRKIDGTYEVKTPTPGMNNDGSGIVFNYLTVAANASELNEGQNLVINFTTSQAVTVNPLVINFTLNNYAFSSSDFSGNLTTTIPVGATTATATISLLNDGVNDGDEEAKISVNGLPVQYSLNNNNVIVRVDDINFNILPFGSPINPTFGTVANTIPVGYYDSIDGLSGAALKQGLQDIIANPAVVHAQNYGDVYDILKQADQNPANSNQVWLIYTEQPRSKIDYQTGNSIIGKWNREHIYCQSRGGFSDGTSSTPDGINVWLPTSANDILSGHGDAHHIRAVDGQENSSRNNRNYGVDYNGPAGSTTNAWKGDVARALFYMAVRYNGLNVVNGNPADLPVGYIGDLATLLSWNTLDPADDFEMNRNNIIQTWQQNRNPFIDMPNLASYIFGNNVGQVWHSTLSVANNNVLDIKMYPNPATNFLQIDGLSNLAVIEIYNAIGEKVLAEDYSNLEKINFNLQSGIYLVKIVSDNKSVTKKLIIN